MPLYRVHFWINKEHSGPYDVPAPDPRSGLEDAIANAVLAGVNMSGYYEHTIAEQDQEGHWRLLG